MLCPCSKLTPLQARLLASASALAFLVLIYWSLTNPHFAYAAELAVDGSGRIRDGEDHNWYRIQEVVLEDEEDESPTESSLVARDEASLETGHAVVQRAVAQTQVRGNNIGTPQNLDPGDVTVWQYPNSVLQQDLSGNGTGFPSDLDAKRSLSSDHADLRKRDNDDEEGTLERRQTNDLSKAIYISATTCQQPNWIGEGPQTVRPPQLTLWVSTASGNTNVGPGGNMDQQDQYAFVNGSVSASVVASGDWYMAVSAPEIPSSFTGVWNYQLAVSLDDYFHSVNTSTPFLYLLDTDSSAALLTTGNLTLENASSSIYQQWQNLSPPFIVFATNLNVTETMGVENSFCGLENAVSRNRQIEGSQTDLDGTASHVQMDITTRGLGHYPKQQFYISNLNSSSQYQAFLAMRGNSTASGDGVVGGGGTVWSPATFATKSDGNCQLMFNLSFCDEVAYAAPSNPNTMPTAQNLQAFYDNYTYTWYQNFNYSLAQIPCHTTADAQYSLAKNCTHCAAAYKEWLCAVSIPRCEDFSRNETWLQVRNVGQPFYHNNTMLDSDFLLSNYVPMLDAPRVQGSNAFEQTYNWSFATNRSRNPDIDTQVMPGPYREVLPCEDLCFNLMQSCPAALQFACPYRGRGLEAGYGKRGDGVKCSFLGAYHDVSGAQSLHSSVTGGLTVAVLAGAWLMLL